MLRVVCWKWTPVAGYRSKFSAAHVNTLRSMVARHLKMPYEFVCITDNPKGIDSGVRIIPLWDDHSTLLSPHGGLNPSCYRRLKAFAPEMREIIGERFVSMDLDVVVTGDLTPLFDRVNDFVIWGDQLRSTPYNGSMWMMDAGARAKVWSTFDPVKSPKLTMEHNLLGSDQAWISYCLGPRERKWTTRDGVYAYRTDIRRAHFKLPAQARVVFFQGIVDPWSPIARKNCSWIEEHYR
jgi:hypothetical protein